MAYLKPIKKTYKEHITYHYYSLVKNVHWTKGYKLVSLGTTDLKEARKRHQEVENNERAVKDGDDVQWSWKSDNGRTKILRKTLGGCVDEWLHSIKVSIRQSSVDRYKCSLNAFINVMGKTCPMSAINNKSIENFKRFYLGKHKKGGIDINLRGIKKFLLWAYEEEYIKKMPKVKQFNEKTPPKYINQVDWRKLMQLDIDDYWKNLWKLYRDLGCRLKEILEGEIDGDFLIVSAEDTKSKKVLEIPITEEQKGIIQAIHTRRDEHLSNGYKMVNFRDNISKIFKRSCKRVGVDYNFHCLRHTFAVRKYLETRDIMLVSKMMNHESLQPTEQYTKFNIHRLEQDFPILSEKQVRKDDLETIKVETTNYQFATSRLIN